jgi:hypothetical protein
MNNFSLDTSNYIKKIKRRSGVILSCREKSENMVEYVKIKGGG